ncbi:hypothetical protein BDW71DRAFT_179101 [Aspergillus fruticulosus]
MVLNHLAAPILTTAPQKAQNASPPREEPCDPNIPDHRLSINRPCIYERRLPGNAYITAHVQRLQHGYYSTSAVSDRDMDHVDFLALSFVFHSPDTRDHRFKAATIRASLHYPSYSYGHRDNHSSRGTISPLSSRHKPNHPHFLKHAPHFLHGSIVPETLQWNYSLSGSLGVAQLPLIASLSPTAGLNRRFNRYEMMRIQGSVRSKDGIPASQIVWTLEENTLQRSGLPREFTFAMLIAKPGPESRVQFALEIEPVLQCWFLGEYPGWWVKLWKRYRAVTRKRGVDFRVSVGQRFGGELKSRSHSYAGPSRRGFNFAKLVAGLDEYVTLSGARVVAAAGRSSTPQGQPDSPMPQPPTIEDPAPAPKPNPIMPTPCPGQLPSDGVLYPFPMPPGQGYGPGQAPEQGPWPRQPHHQSRRQHPAHLHPHAKERARAQESRDLHTSLMNAPNMPARTSSSGQCGTLRTRSRR